MGWSFRESVKILPGVRLNFSRRGVGASIGGKGVHLGVGGGRAPRITGGFGPFRYYKSLGADHETRHRAAPVRAGRGLGGVLIKLAALFCLVLLCLFAWYRMDHVHPWAGASAVLPSPAPTSVETQPVHPTTHLPAGKSDRQHASRDRRRETN